MRSLHVGLRVKDLERSLGFYTSVGYEVVGTVPATELGFLTMLKLPRDEFVTLELVYDPDHGWVDVNGLSHFVVDVHPHLARRRPDARRALACRDDMGLLEQLRPS